MAKYSSHLSFYSTPIQTKNWTFSRSNLRPRDKLFLLSTYIHETVSQSTFQFYCIVYKIEIIFAFQSARNFYTPRGFAILGAHQNRAPSLRLIEVLCGALENWAEICITQNSKMVPSVSRSLGVLNVCKNCVWFRFQTIAPNFPPKDLENW